MASSMAVMTMPRSIAFSRATASAICKSSSRLALTAAMVSISFVIGGVPACRRRAPHRLRTSAQGRRSIFRFNRLGPLRLAFRRFSAPERFGDELVGEHELRFRHVLHAQQDLDLFARRRIRTTQARGVALHSAEDAAETLAARDRYR